MTASTSAKDTGNTAARSRPGDPALGLGATVAVHALRTLVPVGDPAVPVTGEDGVVAQVEQGAVGNCSPLHGLVGGPLLALPPTALVAGGDLSSELFLASAKPRAGWAPSCGRVRAASRRPIPPPYDEGMALQPVPR